MPGARRAARAALALLAAALLAPYAVAADEPVSYALHYVGEVLADTSGGMQRGAVYDGRLELVLNADLDELAGWRGFTAHLNAYQLHGRGLSRNDVGNMMTVSNIEALPATRLYEAWLERRLFDDRLALRAGQLGADTQFLTSEHAGLFINGTFGWPMIMGSDLPSGGPAFPLATPGISARYDASPRRAFLLGVYDGNPAGPGSNDPQERDRNGLNFRIHDRPLVMAEAQFRHGEQQPGGGLPGTVKLGAWMHFGRFDDLRYATDGLSLADPASNGQPLQHEHDYGLYAVLDQQLYRLPDQDKGIGTFLRVATAPSDRNLVHFYFDTGLTFSGFIRERPNDAFGVALGYGRISSSARALDRDRVFFTGVHTPVEDFEAALELTYSARVARNWTVQPDLQFIFHPGGHVANPLDPSGTAAIRNAVIAGVRTSITF
ncbi:MAG: carbohydrate porin [Betaproteobacteria bacterium]|nr:carbohydrate porin [Betaproteobacteria bacterium]